MSPYELYALDRAIADSRMAIDRIQAVVKARKEALEEDGFTPEAAERMAETLWAAMMPASS